MVVERPILTANSHGDRFLCNTFDETICFLEPDAEGNF